VSIDVHSQDRIAMSQRERDLLKVMGPVVQGQRTQGEAARLADLSVRQIRRIQRKLEEDGDAALVHGLRGKPSNRRFEAAFRRKVLAAYRQQFAGFGPTFACEKLVELDLVVSPDTLRRWLIDEGLWQRRRQRDPHRSRRPRRSCFGELVQMDASIHDWLEGRGEDLVLLSMIDDATSRVMARFYRAGTVETHLDLLGRWLRQHGRPLALYTDRHSIFEPQDKGRALPEGTTQFGRALSELDIELIRAHSPQAKGRVERSFGTAQDRWVKELRLAGAKTVDEANTVLERVVPDHNRRFAKPARQSGDGHRSLGSAFHLAAILSIQEQRVVSNDYIIRFHNRFYQLQPPIYPGERGGRVIVETRLDGTMAIRFQKHYLKYDEVVAGTSLGGSAPKPPEFSALAADASGKEKGRASSTKARPSGVQPTAGRSGRTPAEPYPPDGARQSKPKAPWRPAEDHPWRNPSRRRQHELRTSGHS
jgi:helix-turn-helix protein